MNDLMQLLVDARNRLNAQGSLEFEVKPNTDTPGLYLSADMDIPGIDGGVGHPMRLKLEYNGLSKNGWYCRLVYCPRVWMYDWGAHGDTPELAISKVLQQPNAHIYHANMVAKGIDLLKKELADA